MNNELPRPREPHVIILRLAGRMMRLDDTNLESLLGDLLEKSHSHFILDFDRVEFIDSAGIGLIMKIAAEVQKASGELVMCNPRSNVKNVFVMLGIESRFRIYDRLGDAIQHFGNLARVELINVKF
ncbi:MAG: STAS domain-containing protein [bacterium]